jgi:hypothetical protein
VSSDEPRRDRPDLRAMLHPRLVLAAFLVALLMLPVGIALSAAGVGVLKLSGGAARDTSIVVAIAGFLVTDFWGGGIVAAMTKVTAIRVALAWAITRLVVLVVVALVANRMAPFIPVQLAFAVPAAWAGARASRKQAALRRQQQAHLRRIEVARGDG